MHTLSQKLSILIQNRKLAEVRDFFTKHPDYSCPIDPDKWDRDCGPKLSCAINNIKGSMSDSQYRICLELIDYLLSARNSNNELFININQAYVSGKIALHYLLDNPYITVEDKRKLFNKMIELVDGNGNLVINVNQETWFHGTPLMDAVRSGDPQIARSLLTLKDSNGHLLTKINAARSNPPHTALDVVNTHLIDHPCYEEIKQMLITNGGKLAQEIQAQFLEAVRIGDAARVTYFFNQYSDTYLFTAEVIQQAVLAAVKNNHLDIVKYLVDESSRITSDMIKLAVLESARHGDLHIVKYIIDYCSDKGLITTDLIQQAFQIAVTNNHLDIVKYLVDESSLVTTETIKLALLESVRHGDLHILKHMIDCCSDKGLITTDLIQQAFQIAVINKHFDMVKYLFGDCVKCGHLRMVKDFIKQLDHHSLSGTGIMQDFFIEAFQVAVDNNNLDMVTLLIKQEWLGITRWLSGLSRVGTDICSVLCDLIKQDKVKMLQFIIKIDPIKIVSMRHYKLTVIAVEYNKLDVVKLLVDNAQFCGILPDMLRVSGVTVLVDSILIIATDMNTTNHDVLRYLIKMIKNQEMGLCFQILKRAKEKLKEEVNLREVIQHELCHKIVLDLCKYYVDEEFKDRLLTEESQQLCFDILWIFISLLPSGFSQHNIIQCLLSHSDIQQHCIQDHARLLQLAVGLKYIEATLLLMGVPQVFAYANANPGLVTDLDSGLGLDLDRYRGPESAYEFRFSTKEMSYREALQQRYECPTGKDSQDYITKLKAEIIRRYAKSPATFKNKQGGMVDLPLTWADWSDLQNRLSSDEKSAALQAYYQHDVHNAYRFLQQPNYWMSPSALFVQRGTQIHANCNPMDGAFAFTNEAWDALALVFRAVSDKTIDGINGVSTEDRFCYFLMGLKHINRAHNWDNGVDRGKNPDRPGCNLRNGFYSRLYTECIVGHPLMNNVLTDDAIKQYVFSFVLNKYNLLKQKLIDEGTWHQHCAAFREYIYSLSLNGILHSFDIPFMDKVSLVKKFEREYPKASADNRLLFYRLLHGPTADIEHYITVGELRLDYFFVDRIVKLDPIKVIFATVEAKIAEVEAVAAEEKVKAEATVHAIVSPVVSLVMFNIMQWWWSHKTPETLQENFYNLQLVAKQQLILLTSENRRELYEREIDKYDRKNITFLKFVESQLDKGILTEPLRDSLLNLIKRLPLVDVNPGNTELQNLVSSIIAKLLIWSETSDIHAEEMHLMKVTFPQSSCPSFFQPTSSETAASVGDLVQSNVVAPKWFLSQ